MDHHDRLPRSRAVAGAINGPDHPEPLRLPMPSVLVAGASESGTRYGLTHRTPDVDVDVDVDHEDDAPRQARGRR